MTWGNATKVFNGNNVKIELDDSAGTLQEVVMMTNFSMTKDLPVRRSSTRDGPVDTPSYYLREFNITAEMTEDLYDRLEVLCDETDRGGVTVVDWRMEAENHTQDADNAVLAFRGWVRRFEGRAASDTLFEATFVCRVINGSESVS